MQRIRRTLWTCLQTCLFWACLSSLATDAWARGEGAPEKSTGGASIWVWAYILVILGIALGMLVVCKSSGRRDRAKPEAYGEGKSTQEEESKGKK
jgi:hypothetical protein